MCLVYCQFIIAAFVNNPCRKWLADAIARDSVELDVVFYLIITQPCLDSPKIRKARWPKLTVVGKGSFAQRRALNNYLS